MGLKVLFCLVGGEPRDVLFLRGVGKNPDMGDHHSLP